MIKPTTIRTRVGSQAGALTELADWLAAGVVQANRALLDPATVNPRLAAEDAGIKPKGSHSDPTSRQALNGIDRVDDVYETLYVALDTLDATVRVLTEFAERWAPNEGVRVRCSGGRTVEEWSNPTCGNWAELTPSGHPRGDQLCAACRKRKERWERRSNDGAAA